MRLLLTPALLWLVVSGESLFDEDEVAAYKEKQGEHEEPAGESLFDDDEVSAYQAKQAEEYEPIDNGVTFSSKDKSLTNDIVFDERGNIAQGGSTDPDIAFWHVAELNGERFDEPTQGSDKLMELIEKGEDYEVILAPPSFNQFQCTEKVHSIEQLFEEYSHEYPEEFLAGAAATLAREGIMNSKQLGEVDPKDFDAIMGVPAIIKTRLRKIATEARKQSEVAGKEVDMDGTEVEEELKKYMADRERTKGGNSEANATMEEVQVAGNAAADQPPGDMEEEDGTFKSLVWAVLNCPTCKGKETIACFRTCRYGDGVTKRTWSDCLSECIENRWLRATFYAILPSEK